MSVSPNSSVTLNSIGARDAGPIDADWKSSRRFDAAPGVFSSFGADA